MNIYDFNVKKMDGEMVSLKDYEGKLLLIVNTATGCGFTPQYEELERMYEKYKDQDFVILDFPCDQFGHQAPGSNEEIASFCTAKFGVSFPQFAKIEVNGEHAIPLFQYLQKEKAFEGFGEHELSKLLEDMLAGQDADYASKPDIKWNFTKFVVDRDGKVAARFEPTADGAKVEECIQALL